MPYYPNPNDAERVRSFVRAGILDPERIAKHLRCSADDVSRCYPFELELTDEESLAAVADVAYDMATCGKFPHMTIFWLSRRGGTAWQEKKQEEVPNTTPITVIFKQASDEAVA